MQFGNLKHHHFPPDQITRFPPPPPFPPNRALVDQRPVLERLVGSYERQTLTSVSMPFAERSRDTAKPCLRKAGPTGISVKRGFTSLSISREAPSKVALPEFRDSGEQKVCPLFGQCTELAGLSMVKLVLGSCGFVVLPDNTALHGDGLNMLRHLARWNPLKIMD